MDKEAKWEKYKKKDETYLISTDEVLVFILGFFVFVFFPTYRIFFIISVVVWYWLKIRFYESKIIAKEKEIYNIYYENAANPYMSQSALEGKTEHDRKPMKYDLRQLENKRKFLVDKFIILNLVLILLIELFIK